MRLLKDIYTRMRRIWIAYVLGFLKRTSLPGFAGVPIYDVLSLIVKEIQRDDIVTRANGMAFNFFLSLFPILLILVSLLPYVPIEGFESTFYTSIFNSLPDDTKNFVQNTIESLRTMPRGNLISTSLLMSLFFASNGILSMIKGFEKSYEISFQNRNFIKKRMVALWLLILLSALVIGGCFVILVGQTLRSYILENTGVDHINIVLLGAVKWLFVFSIIYSMISSIYRFAPAFRRKTGFFSPGAMLATTLIIVTTLLFSLYVNRFDTYNKIYGSIGAIIATMVWIEINCFNLLIGFELNASITVNRDLKGLRQEEVQI